MLVGRSGELGRLDALVVSACRGAGGQLVLVGDPGMGRSALLDAVHRRAARRGLRVLHVRATPGMASMPGSLLEAIRGTNGSTRRPAPSWPEAHEALALLDACAEPGPVLLLVDDAHHADTLSLTTLRTAIERVGRSPCAVVVAGTPDPALPQQLAGWPRLRLEPLDRESAGAVLRANLGLGSGTPVPDHVTDALHGNPHALVAAHDLLSDDQLTGRAPLPYPMPMPTALLTGWSPALDRLGQPAQDALLDLAVSGGRLALLTAMAESGQALAEGLDEAEQSGVLVLGTPGHAAFRTATVRDVVLARAPAGQRRRAHRRAAEAARATGTSTQHHRGPPGPVGHHRRRLHRS